MEHDMHQSGDDKYIPMTSFKSGEGVEVRDDVYYYTNQIVNIVFIENLQDNSWILVDAGMPRSSREIIKAAEDRFGKGARPLYILLTHGHFDHIGSIVKLINHWNVPVFAHPLEFPYLTGAVAYPEPDPTVEGGLLAKIASFYPHEAIDISDVLHPLPDDYSIPGFKDWRWIHTPGHSPGHVSIYRERDQTLIAGDAFVSVRQDSLYKVLFQKKEVNGPPRYFTTDWQAAKASVQSLAALDPALAVTGHGPYLYGHELSIGLTELAAKFDQIALPKYGKYVDNKGIS